MYIKKIKFSKFYFGIFLLLVIILLIYLAAVKFEKNKIVSLEPIKINLLTSSHKSLLWKFKPTKPIVFVRPGDVTTIDYIVENLSNEDTTGVATFGYFPKEFGSYISKINCFCYDAQTLKSKEIVKYSLVIFIDPKVTKDSKTKNVKEITIQFIFFDYNEYKKNES